MLIGFVANPDLATCPGAIIRWPLWIRDGEGNPIETQVHVDRVAHWKAANVEPLLVLDSNTFSAEDWEAQQFAARLEELAQAIPDATYVEAGNEPEGTGGPSSQQEMQDYYALITAARQAWPNATIISGGLVGIDFSYFEGVKDAGADIAGFHPYAQFPDTIGNLVTACRKAVGSSAAPIPLWATEFGTDVIPEPDRTAWFAGMLDALWQNGVKAACIYRYDNDGSGFAVQVTGSVNAIVNAVPTLAADPPVIV